MSWVLEIAANGHARFAALSHAWFQRDALRSLLPLPDVIHADLYSPVAGRAVDPFVAPAAGPLIVAIVHFRTVDGLRMAISSAALERCLAQTPAGLALTSTPMSGKAYAVDEPQAEARQAAYRYVVRYHGPSEEAARFADQYERTHPPLLARLPRIRAIECYRPLAALRTPRCAPADYLIGNEVEFDSAEDLNAAMISPERVALRSDFDALPRVFRGNTHVAMRRERHHAPA